jgi:hypothetical protein
VLLAVPANGDSDEEVLWRKEIAFTLATGKRVSGFAALRETGSTTYAGFAIFRKNRLIEGSSDQTFRPAEIFGASNSYSYQRLFGELHLDGFSVTHNKTAIVWQEGEQEEFIRLLREAVSEGPMNLLYQAEKFRKKEKVNPNQVQEALDSVKINLERSLPVAFERISPNQTDVTTAIPEQISQDRNQADVVASQVDKEVMMRIETHEHGVWNVHLKGIYDESMSNFFEIGSESSFVASSGRHETKVDVMINLAHPFSLQHIGPSLEHSELLFAFTSCLAIALSLGKSMGARSAYIVDYLNDILRFKGTF